MSVYATVAVPPAEFVLSRTLAVAPSASLAIETVVPFGERPLPYLRIEADDPELVVDLVAAERTVVRVDVVHSDGDAAVVAVCWRDQSIPLVETVVAAEGACVEAVASGGTWHLSIRFPDHEHVTEWYRRCRERGFGLTVERVCERPPSDEADPSGLTDPQLEALGVALEAGYFEVPRGATLEEVASLLGVSDTAASQRIRRGVSGLLESSLPRRVDALE